MVKFATDGTKVKNEEASEDSDINISPSPKINTSNGASKRKLDDGEGSKKRKRKRELKANGQSHSRRRHSVSKPARDPRDEASPPTPATERSPSPVIDFDGLSRPSKICLCLIS